MNATVCLRGLLFLGIALVGSGCSFSHNYDYRSKYLFSNGDFERAVTSLDKDLGPDIESRDALLFLLDRGIILHTAGLYEESNRYLLEAGSMADRMDVIIMTEEAGTIFTNENAREYRPEDFERILIHTYLAMNFALMDDIEEALVECRKVQQELFAISHFRSNDFEPNAYTLYLSALLYEAMGDTNDAYIDYVRVYEKTPHLPYLAGDLLRSSKMMNFTEEHELWEKTFSNRPTPFRDADPQNGDVVVFVQCGRTPAKIPNRSLPIVPDYRILPSEITHVEITREGSPEPLATSHQLFDIQDKALSEMEHRTGALVAKRIAILAAKEVGVRVLEHSVKKKYGKNTAAGIGLLLRILLFSLEEPDLRNWQTLPANLQIARLRLPPGTHTLTVNFHDRHNRLISSATIENVHIAPGKWKFLNIRTVK